MTDPRDPKPMALGIVVIAAAAGIVALPDPSTFDAPLDAPVLVALVGATGGYVVGRTTAGGFDAGRRNGRVAGLLGGGVFASVAAASTVAGLECGLFYQCYVLVTSVGGAAFVPPVEGPVASALVGVATLAVVASLSTATAAVTASEFDLLRDGGGDR